MKGTILLANEGINATISAPKDVMEKFWTFLNQDIRFKNMAFKESYASFHPFEKMKIRLKKEIVRLAVDDLDITERGEYLNDEKWDEVISDPEVKVIDTRNDYEYMLGSFENAINPKTDDFRNFPKWAEENLDPKKHKKIAMFCTGGIRCEKSTALLKQQGFEEVYHLEGGILQYLENKKNKNEKKSKWSGHCFVFDDRIAVDKNLDPVKGSIICKDCGNVLQITTDDVMHGYKEQKIKNGGTGINNKGVNCKSLGLECLNV